jgi:hypothetical protein
MAGSIRVLAGKVKSVFDWFRHLIRSGNCASGYVAVCTKGEWIALPIVRVTLQQKRMKLFRVCFEQECEHFAHLSAEIISMQLCKRIGTRAANPASEVCVQSGKLRPPGGGSLLERK